MSAHLRLLATTIEAAHSSVVEEHDLPTNTAQYASEQAEIAPESSRKESLYQKARKMKEHKASKGGISDATGTPDSLEPHFSTQPNAQRSLNGFVLQATLRLLADRLGTEEDDLVKDQENYGTHGSASEEENDIPELLDPALNSTYGRENNANRNTTNPDQNIEASSTNDSFEFADGFDMLNDEGIGNTSEGVKRSGTQMKTLGKDVHDGDFDPAGRQTGDRLITEDPRTNGYLNIHAAEGESGGEGQGEGGEGEGAGGGGSTYPMSVVDNPTADPDATDENPNPDAEFLGDDEDPLEDASLEALASEEVEVEADADPRLWNMANQPLGMAG